MCLTLLFFLPRSSRSCKFSRVITWMTLVYTLQRRTKMRPIWFRLKGGAVNPLSLPQITLFCQIVTGGIRSGRYGELTFEYRRGGVGQLWAQQSMAGPCLGAQVYGNVRLCLDAGGATLRFVQFAAIGAQTKKSQSNDWLLAISGKPSSLTSDPNKA